MSDILEQAWPFAAAVLVVLGAAVLVALLVVLVRAAKSMGHINTITQQAEQDVTPALKRIEPLVDRAELTIDTLNLELLRVDAILEDVEQVTDVAGKTADTVNVITNAPTNAVAGLADKLRSTFSSRRKAKMKEGRVVYPIAPVDAAGDADEAAPDVRDAAEPAATDAASEAAPATDTAAAAPADTAAASPADAEGVPDAASTASSPRPDAADE